MNVQKIKGRMVELKISGQEMAKKLGMNSSTFYRKLQNNGENFTVKDLYGIAKELDLSKEQAVDFLLY